MACLRQGGHKSCLSIITGGKIIDNRPVSVSGLSHELHFRPCTSASIFGDVCFSVTALPVILALVH
jgi:hypothetical protein